MRQSIVKRDVGTSLSAMRVGIRTGISASVAIMALQLSGWAHASAEQTKVILVINPAEVFSPSAQIVDHAMYEVFSSASQKLEILSEHPAVLSDPPSKFDLDVIDQLKKKYSDRRIDLVIARGPRALDFVENHGASLWPGVPSMYYAVSDSTIYWSNHSREINGVFIDHDFPANVALILHLQPGLKNLIQLVATTRSEEVLAMHTKLKAIVGSMRNDIHVETLSETALPELLKYLSALPSNTAVLATTVDRDRDGVRYGTDEILKAISIATTAPLYGMRSSYMGKGTVGGQVIDLSEHGRQAALLALQLLARTEGGPIVKVSQRMRCVVDDRQIRRWNFNFNDIPSACERLFHIPTFWDRYKAQITAFTAMSSIIIVLMLGLQWQRKRRLTADEEANRQRTALAHVARLGSVGELTASIVHEINQPLGAILANADAATMMLNRQPESNCHLKAILADIRDDNLRVSQTIQKLRMLLSKRSLELKPVSLNEVVDTCKSLLGNLAIKHHAVIHTDLVHDLPMIMGDSTHLQQILINLASNAMDAMSSVPPPQRVLTVCTGLTGVSHAKLVVSDRGTGIPTNIRPNIFSSFYTTKPEGMGMGLAIVQTIVETHKGTIETFNNANGGATFVVKFPVAIV